MDNLSIQLASSIEEEELTAELLVADDVIADIRFRDADLYCACFR